jgi:hypothetical protein
METRLDQQVNRDLRWWGLLRPVWTHNHLVYASEESILIGVGL